MWLHVPRETGNEVGKKNKKPFSCGTAFGHMRAVKNRNNTCWLYFSQTRLDQISWSQVRTAAELTHDFCLSHLVDISHEAQFQEETEGNESQKGFSYDSYIMNVWIFSHEKCLCRVGKCCLVFLYTNLNVNLKLMIMLIIT